MLFYYYYYYLLYTQHPTYQSALECHKHDALTQIASCDSPSHVKTDKAAD